MEPPTESSAIAPSTALPVPRPRQLPYHLIHKQPAPLRVFPFPTFNPSNPISLVHLAVVWLKQVFFPPPPEPFFVHTAYWDNDTRSIIVSDEKSILDLWQQGFYGKGSLSRSEPNWLKREKIRRGALEGVVSEENTDKRREERMHTKWERARLEQEALEQKRLGEAKILAAAAAEAAAVPSPSPIVRAILSPLPPVGPLELLALPNSNADLVLCLQSHARGSANSKDGTEVSLEDSASSGNDEVESDTTVSDINEVKHRKSVRFSPDVQSNIFQHADPPTPPCSLPSSPSKVDTVTEPNGAGYMGAQSMVPTADVPPLAAAAEAGVETVVVNKEHLQLAPQEAFFLVFALGVLKVVDNTTQETLSTMDLLSLLRQNSYFPPRSLDQLQPDDPFLIQYVVYHHFRSLGWVTRPGIKFGCDCKLPPLSLPSNLFAVAICEFEGLVNPKPRLIQASSRCLCTPTKPRFWPSMHEGLLIYLQIGLIYMRGPAFDHAEYGLAIMPYYSDPEWKAMGREAPRKSWEWLFGLNRVLSKVYKTLVLVYVDIPPPSVFGKDSVPTNLVDVLKQYKIQETVWKRWSPNRNRQKFGKGS